MTCEQDGQMSFLVDEPRLSLDTMDARGAWDAEWLRFYTNGRSADLGDDCPYEGLNRREAWFAGWEEPERIN